MAFDSFSDNGDEPGGELHHDFRCNIEYDTEGRVARVVIDDSPETGAGEMETPIEFTYLDATTMKVVARDDDFEEVYTVTLDAAGRAVKVVSEGESVVWTTSYDAAGYAQSCVIEDPMETSYDFRPPGRFHLERR